MAPTEDGPEPPPDDALATLCARAQAAWVRRWTRSWRVRHPGGALVEVAQAAAPTLGGLDPKACRWLRLDPDAAPCDRRPGQPRAVRAQLDDPCWRLALGGRPALIVAGRALLAWPRPRRDAALIGVAEALPCGSELIFTAAEAPPAHPRLHLVERRAPLDLGALDDPPAWAPLAAPLAWLTAPDLRATTLWRLAVCSDGAW
ncbi:hypothetical protein L6R46_01740 [Myxococcota bacterium]|nr:hypothetical protein [Myxococcota bacterium]